jgi:hypothetical protein
MERKNKVGQLDSTKETDDGYSRYPRFLLVKSESHTYQENRQVALSWLHKIVLYFFEENSRLRLKIQLFPQHCATGYNLQLTITAS